MCERRMLGRTENLAWVMFDFYDFTLCDPPPHPYDNITVALIETTHI
jgi:hypothetical protein